MPPGLPGMTGFHSRTGSGGGFGDALSMASSSDVSGSRDAYDPSAPHRHAAAFLSSISLRVDPAVPPPPLYPLVPFSDAIQALRAVTPAEWAYWSGELRARASEAFLAHIPLGHENAYQRAQPMLHLPQSSLQSIHDGGSGADSLPAFQPALSAASSLSGTSAAANLSLMSLDSSAPLAVPAASRAGTGVGVGPFGGGAAGDVMLLYAGDVSRPVSPAAASGLHPPMPLPLRLQTPPPLMGMGATAGLQGGGGMINGNEGAAAVVGAHVFGNPLLFPSTLSAPLDLTRSTTEQLSLLALARPPLPRSATEHPYGLLPSQQFGGASGLLPPYPTPNLSQQHSLQDADGGAGAAGCVDDNMMLLPTSMPAFPADAAAAAAAADGGVMRTPKALDRDQSSSISELAVPYRSPPGAADTGAANAVVQQQQQQMAFSSPQQQSHSLHPSAASGGLRLDGTGRGLRDSDAYFVPERPPGQSSEEWEKDLIGRGIMDGRIVMTPLSISSSRMAAQQQQPIQAQKPPRKPHPFGGPGSSRMGAPVWISSLAPYVPSGGSNSSTAPHTPNLSAMGSSAGALHGLANRSRVGSFSLEQPSALLAASGGLLALGLGMSASSGSGEHVGDNVVSSASAIGGAGKNPMLALVTATAARQAAQELAESGGEDAGHHDGGSSSVYGKRQGTSYAYLLPPRVRGHGSLAAQGSNASSSAQSESDEKGGGSSSLGASSALLPASSSAGSSAGAISSGSVLPSTTDVYDPCFLDDPNIRSGRHRVVLQLSGFMSSLVSYVRSKDLQSELNESFASRHGAWLAPQAQMSLSKIRKLKQLLLDVCVRLDLELSTCAVSYIYLERLVQCCHVHKANRRLVAAVCLLLATKWVEGSCAGSARKRLFAALFPALEKTFHVTRAQVMRAEFPLYVALEFDLSVRPEHVLHHLRQALSKMDEVPADYRHIEWSM